MFLNNVWYSGVCTKTGLVRGFNAQDKDGARVDDLKINRTTILPILRILQGAVTDFQDIKCHINTPPVLHTFFSCGNVQWNLLLWRNFPGIAQWITKILLFIRIYRYVFKEGPFKVNNTFSPTNNPIIKIFYNLSFFFRLIIISSL